MFKLTRRGGTFVREYVLNNWQYKLSAFAAACIIWAYVAGQQSMQAVYKVPAYFQNLPVNCVLADTQVQQIQITISGRRDRILSLKERQIWVAIELSNMKPGKNSYTLSRNDVVVPAGIEVKTISPRKIVINLQQIRN